MFKGILSTATFKQSQITIVATIINGALGAGFYILMARFLGPANFGLLTVSIATLTLLADILDFGTNTGIVRFVSASLVSNKDKAFRFLKLSLEIKMAVWSLLLIVGIVLAPGIAINIFNKTELAIPLQLVMVGVGGALFFSFATSSLQAFQKYFNWGIINILTNSLRLLFIFILLFYQQLNLISGLLAYILFPFFGFSLALLLIPTKRVITVKNEFSVAKELFSYNFWVALFVIIAAISSRLDTFLTARLLTVQELGIYGAANQLVQVVPQIVGALGVVAAPKFAGFTSIKQMIEYFKKFQLMVIGLSLLILFAIPLSFYIIPLLFGSQYSATIFPFIILLLAMLVFLISVPLHNSIIYYFGKPRVFVWVSIIHLFIIGIFGYFLISKYGVIGAAFSVLVGMLFNLLAPLAWLIYRIKSGK